MEEKVDVNKKLIIFLTVLVLVAGVFIPITEAKTDISNINRTDRGPSHYPVIPIKKTTMVDFDEDTLIDDYSYLAALPTTVFKTDNKLISHPLLYYQDEYQCKTLKERSLNARQGLDYFMDDWMGYCNGNQDQMTLINVDKNDVKQWNAKEYTIIDSDNPYDIASQLAIKDWSYSEDAVVAVIDKDYVKLENEESNTLSGTITIDKPIKTEHFTIEQTNRLNPVSEYFTVPEGYKYIYARCWYPSVTIKVSLPIPGFEMTRQLVIPSGDKDLQLYCQHKGEWMQVMALDSWNSGGGMDNEKDGTYIYKTGQWRATVTDIPTKKLVEIVEKHGSWLDILKNLRKVVYQVDITMYDGERLALFEDLPFDCRDVKIELDTKSSENIGFCLIGPSGDEIACDTEGIIEVGKLGGLLPGESYDIVVYSKDEEQGSIDYELSYSYKENRSKRDADYLTNAAEGSILASMINAPLLYTTRNSIPQETIDTLHLLGVENLYIVDLGNNLKKSVEDELKDIAKIQENYNEHTKIYDDIREITDSNDIVVSTVEPWKPWLVFEKVASNEIETPYAFHIGPAAYCAAHHGTPLLIIENHPELSSAVVWHTEYWNNGCSENPIKYQYIPTSDMYLTGKRAYDFFDKLGFDKSGLESMITVAGQFCIGASWDRVFFGKASYGRFFGSPVDTAYWISRNMFYPELIFENPAMNPDGMMMENGSISHRRNILPWFKGGLILDRKSGEEKMTYPVLSSFLHYEHRFNERASNYWGFEYECADGLKPGKSYTMNPIDQGVSAYINEMGSIFPDMSISDVLPAYLSKGGYDNALCTNFDSAIKNINNGVLLWNHFAHGFHQDGGVTQYFYNKNDPNPWRMYEFYLGSTKEPDTLTIEIHGILPALLGDPNMNGFIRTALDFAPAKTAIRDKISKLLSITPIVRRFIPEGILDTQDYYDGMINTLLLSKMGAITVNGTMIDDAIENLHSAGYITNACLMATKYIHLAIIRHGSSYQIMDPWPTSWYGSVWSQSVPRDIILGNTVGEAFNKGISHVGILYLTDPPQWWWDNSECVCYYGDPDLRMFVPNTQYSDANYWEEDETEPLIYDSDLNLNGHMPFGASSHPREKEPQPEILVYIVIAVVIIVLLFIIYTAAKNNKKNKEKNKEKKNKKNKNKNKKITKKKK